MANKTTPGIQNLRGSIGIGTTSPDEKLSVVGNTGLYGTVSGGIVSPASLRFFTSEDGAGLGDSTDSNKQKIGQITWAGKDTSLNATGEYAAIRTYLIDSNNLIQGSGNEGGQIEFSILRHDVGGDPRVEYTAMTINNSANVGIGTTSPAAKLEVVGDTYLRTQLFTDTIRPYSADQLTLLNGGNNYLYVNGNVGIGTTSPATLLSLGAAVDAQKLLLYDSSNNFKYGFGIQSNEFRQFFPSTSTARLVIGTISDSDGSTFSEKVRITSGGNVGIGTTSPAVKLHVDSGNTNHVALFQSTDSTAYIQLRDSGAYSNIVSADGSLLLEADNGSDLANSSIRFSVDASEKMRIDSAGNVGIGTTGPNQKLHVEGAIYAGTANSTSGSLILVGKYNNGNIITIGGEYSNGGIVIGYGVKPSTTASGAFLSSSALANLERGAYTQVGSEHRWWSGAYQTVAEGGAVTMSRTMTLDGAGNLGIGTTSPSRKLHIVDSVWDNSNGGGVIFENSNTVGASLTLKPSASVVTNGANGWALYAGGPGAAIGDGNLGFWAHATNDARMVIQRGGNVGIGTTSPAVKLDVNGDIALKGTSVFNLNSAALTIGDTAGTDSVTTLKLTTAGDSTTVYLDDDGNVGINTATPSYNLTVDSGTNDIGILTASSDSGSYVGFLDNSTSTIPKIGAVGNKLILDASQYVGIKRTDPSYALDVSGTIRATGDVIAYSDARVKENVETIPNALDKVKAMRGVGYNKIGEQKRSIGVIAQEMIEVMPEVVSQDEQGMYSVAYGNLVGVLVEAMKEQQKQIDELKAQLDGITK